MKKKRTRVIIIATGCLLLAFFTLNIIIGLDVKQSIELTEKHFPGDAVETLAAYVDSAVYSLDTRNATIWALGQIGDARALPILKNIIQVSPVIMKPESVGMN